MPRLLERGSGGFLGEAAQTGEYPRKQKRFSGKSGGQIGLF